MLREAFTAILERHLEAASPIDLLLWSARGLGAVDTTLAARVTSGTLQLTLGDQPVISRPLPNGVQSPAQRGRQPPAEAIADTLSEFYAAAWNASPSVRQAGVERLLQAGFEEVFNHLDPYSRYVTAEEAAQSRQRRIGQSGLGLRIAGGARGTILIVAILPDSAASRAGLREGDILLEIDGNKVQAAQISRAAELLEGAPGSEVQLQLQRSGRRFSLTLQRSGPAVPALRAETRDGILWIRLTLFSATTTERLAQVLDESLAGPAAPRGIVLDLRGNRGGILQQAMSVADAFLSNGIVAQSQGRHPAARRIWQAGGGDLAQGRPIVVLVDGRTASAAEIVAAALSDRSRGVIAGSSTLGKGLIQVVVPLPNQAEILISWSRVLAPRGWPVQGVGVIPTVCTSLGAEALQWTLRQLEQGVSPMASVLARLQQANAPVPASEIAALRGNCPPAEGRDLDQAAATFLIDNRVAYESALPR